MYETILAEKEALWQVKVFLGLCGIWLYKAEDTDSIWLQVRHGHPLHRPGPLGEQPGWVGGWECL